MGKSLFKRVRVLFVVFCMVSLLFDLTPLAISAAGTTYYVDSTGGNDANNGISTSTPWKSLNKVNSVTFGSGDKILLKAGSVWNNQQLYPKGSGSSGSPISVDMYGTGNKPVINVGLSYFSGVYLENQQYWEINNLEITNFNGTYGATTTGNYVGAHFRINKNSGTFNHIYIKNCYIHDVDGDSTMHGGNYDKVSGGISYLVLATGTSDLGHFNDVNIENNTITRVCRTGIEACFSAYADNQSSNPVNYSTNVKMTGNILSYCAGDGIINVHSNGVTVQNNIVTYGCDRNETQASAGMWPWSCNNVVYQGNECAYLQNKGADCCAWDFDWENQNITYQYNYSHNNALGQILIMPGNTYHSVFRYNVSANERINSVSTGSGGSDTWFYNNVFYNDNGPNYANYSYNNIYYNCSNISYANTGTNQHDYNCYYGGTTFNEAHGILANPLFTGSAPGDGISSCNGLKLQSTSPCINKGLPISIPGSRDFFGDPIYMDSPDIGIYESSVPGSNNLALNKTATASSVEISSFQSSNATDGNLNTRWSSTYTDSEWIQVDLGHVCSMNEVILNWEAAYGKAFKIQVSNDGASWTDVYSTTSGTGGIQDIIFPTASGRYVRMQGVTRGTSYGYSLYEFGVYEGSSPTVSIWNDSNPGITYTGAWGAGSNSNCFNGDYHSSNTQNDYYVVSFTGTEAKIYGQKNDYCGKADVYVDNVKVATIDNYSASMQFQQLYFDTGVLPRGTHNVKLVVLHQKNSAGVEYYIECDKVEVTN